MVQTPLKTVALPLQLPPELYLIVTDEQFEILAVTNRELRLERTARGELIVNPPTGWETGERNFSITAQLGMWVENNYEMGKAFESSTGFKLPNGATRSPDASWVSKARWEALADKQKKETFAPVCPDFVVELRSDSDNLKPLQDNMKEYMENGSQLGWLIDPKNKRVEVYRLDQPIEALDCPSTLSGEAVLPGFTLSFKRIWT